jgi:hypothetical protein
MRISMRGARLKIAWTSAARGTGVDNERISWMNNQQSGGNLSEICARTHPALDSTSRATRGPSGRGRSAANAVPIEKPLSRWRFGDATRAPGPPTGKLSDTRLGHAKITCGGDHRSPEPLPIAAPTTRARTAMLNGFCTKSTPARSSPYAPHPHACRVSLSRHCQAPETAPTSSAWPPPCRVSAPGRRARRVMPRDRRASGDFPGHGGARAEPIRCTSGVSATRWSWPDRRRARPSCGSCGSTAPDASPRRVPYFV